jgi:hypothetical protein
MASARVQSHALVWINVTANPTADWIARQITEAFPWDDAPRYLIRDRDASDGLAVTRRLAATGIGIDQLRRGHQNGRVEMLIGSIRRECLDHVVVLSEAHLRRALAAYADYYNELRTPNSEQRHTAPSRGRASRHCRVTTDPQRPSPPILQNLIFGTHSRLTQQRRTMTALRHEAVVSGRLALRYGRT